MLTLATACLAANLPLDVELPQGPPAYSPAELKGTPLDMLLQPQPTTLPRAESARSTLLSKPTPRPTSNGEFVTVLGLNMAADNNFLLQISYCCPNYNHYSPLRKYISFH